MTLNVNMIVPMMMSDDSEWSRSFAEILEVEYLKQCKTNST